MKTTHSVAVLPGDGIGPEVVAEAVRAVEAATTEIRFEHLDWSAERYLSHQVSVPAGGFNRLRDDFDAILVGAFGDPRVPSNVHAKEILLGMRSELDLYANVRPARLLDASICPLKGAGIADVDFVVIRENTEGLYAGVGGCLRRGTPDEVAIQEDVNTRKSVERIIRYAFEYAVRADVRDGGRRPRVLMSDKANVMTYAHDLWQRVFAEVQREYPQVPAEHLYVDALCVELVRDPARFDVIVTCNMFGDIVSDLAAALQGGLGVAPSGNIHPGRTSMFEPVHGSAPPLAGQDVANPLGAIRSAAMMLDHLGFTAEAARVERAVLESIRDGKKTRDLGGTFGTREVGEWIATAVAA